MAVVNLASDTQTRPTPAMRQAIAAADVGDEQKLADPTTLALQERVAALLGHEAALFLPSGTMCNVIAFRLHLRRGDEVLVHRTAHPVHFEAGGLGDLAGAMLRTLDGEGGIFGADALEAAIRAPGDRYAPRSRLVSVEQTTNLGGGRVWPLDTVQAVLAVARAHGLKAHLDGARLLNAVVASGVPAADYAAGFDTAWLDFSKGLGAPAGACLAGSAELIDEAWRHKQMLGGALRQSGILAAAGLHALDHHVDRLAEDHAHAKAIAAALLEQTFVGHMLPVETNILIFEVLGDWTPVRFRDYLAKHGVRVMAISPTQVRMVTHLGITPDMVKHTVEVIRSMS